MFNVVHGSDDSARILSTMADLHEGKTESAERLRAMFLVGRVADEQDAEWEPGQDDDLDFVFGVGV
jgi:hypothetical protein